MELMSNLKYSKKSINLFYDDKFRKFTNALMKNPKTWTELKKELGLRDKELQRILLIAENERIIEKKNNKYYLLKETLLNMAFRETSINNIIQTDNLYKFYDIKNNTFYSGIKENEIDNYIIERSQKIKEQYAEIKEHLFKKRKKEFDLIFQSELSKINSEDAKIFLKCNKSKIFQSLYGHYAFYEKGLGLRSIVEHKYYDFSKVANKKTLFLQDKVKIETFNLFYEIFHKMIFPDLLIMNNFPTKFLNKYLKSHNIDDLLKDSKELHNFLSKNKSLIRE